VTVASVLAQVVNPHIDHPSGPRTPKKRHIKHAEKLGEDRDHVEAHRVKSRQ
jgi:hypothetical protein